MKIGIFVGCFNPVHKAHTKIAEELIKNKFADKVVFVPAGDEYKKEGLALGSDRIKMLELALKNKKNCSVSSLEVERKKLYTIETLEYFEKQKSKDDELFLIIGADNLKELYSWHRSKELIEKYKILVVLRNNLKACNFPEYENNKNIIFVDFDMPMFATNVRNAIKAGEQKQAKTMIEKSVFKYIQKNGIYSGEEKK